MRRALIFAIGFVALATNSEVFPAEPAPVCDMNAQQNQMELTMCSARLYEQADAEMNQLYKSQLRYDAKFSKLNKENHVPGGVELLRAAQRAWLAYRDKSCAYENPPDPPGSTKGSSEDELEYRCLTFYTEERVRRLRQYLDCQSKNGPCL